MEKHFELNDDAFEQQFATSALSPDIFTHEAHIRLAWIQLKKYGEAKAIEQVCQQLINFVNFLGVQNKYNQTLTVAAVKAVNHFMQQKPIPTFKDFIDTYPALKNNFKELLATHYSFDIYDSAIAKETYLEPDLLPFSTIQYHILNGDALVETFEQSHIEGNIFVMRECLVIGNVAAETLDKFWEMRGNFIAQQYETTIVDYDAKVKAEFDKLLQTSANAEINLWFGYDLFCQVNVWFIIWFLAEHQKSNKLYIIYPSYLAQTELWNDFGNATPEKLKFCYQHRVPLSERDRDLAKELWRAYQKNDLETLENLSFEDSIGFPTLREICLAQIERQIKNRPQKAIQAIIEEGTQDFYEIFTKFTAQEGIYGFGDLQVKELIKTLNV